MAADDPTGLARDALERVCSGSDRIASRWVAEGHNRGRPIRIWGNVIRQLGLRRTLLVGIASLRGRRA
jgi:hypothetical protein